MPDELKLMALSACDFGTLLSLYDELAWHDLALETMANSYKTISLPAHVDVTSFSQVVTELRGMSFEDRFVPASLLSLSLHSLRNISLSSEARGQLLTFCDMPLLFSLEEDAHWHSSVLQALNRDYAAMLAPFTSNPAGFRNMLRDTGSVVSGSTALWFLLRKPTSWTPNDMDIVTPYSQYDDVLAYLMSLPGAVHVHYVPDDYRYLPGYYGRRRIDIAGHVIDVVQSRTESPFTVVTGYWSTHLMNALTADAFWSAYPSHTMRMTGIVNWTPKGGCYSIAMEKHQQRGFSLDSTSRPAIGVDLTSTCDGYIGCPRRDRVWGDEFTLKIPLLHSSASDLIKSLPGTLTAGWYLGTSGCGNARCLLSSTYRSYCMQWID